MGIRTLNKQTMLVKNTPEFLESSRFCDRLIVLRCMLVTAVSYGYT